LPAGFTFKSTSFRCRFDRLGDPQALARTAEWHRARFEHRIILGESISSLERRAKVERMVERP